MKILGQRSIQTLFSLAFILQVLTPIGIISYLSWKNTENSVEQLVDQLMARVSSRVVSYLHDSLSDAEVILQNNIYALDNKYIQTDTLNRWYPYFFEQIRRSPQIAYVYFGKNNGEYVEIAQAVYLQPPRLRYRVVEPTQIGTLKDFQLSPTGAIKKQVDQSSYDPRKRPWYDTAKQAQQARWSEIYQFSDNPEILGMSLVKSYYDDQQKFQGVLGVDFTLLNLNQILKDFNTVPGSAIFITEPDGKLIANSLDEMPYNQLFQRIQANQLKSPLIRTAAQQVLAKYSLNNRDPLNQGFKFQLDGGLNYGRIFRLQNEQGLNWLVVIVMPEQAFMGQIRQQRQQTAIFILLATLLALATSYALSRWVARPIVQLSRTSQRIAAGDFDAPIPAAQSSQEVNALAQEFTHMRDELQKNQQILESQAHALEDSVQERSLALQQEITARKATNQFLEETLIQLQTTQDQLVRSAKLAALGEMMAAVAHEMNAPLTTIQSMAQRLAGNLTQDFVQLPQMLQALPPPLQHQFFQLLQRAMTTSEDQMTVDPHTVAQLSQILQNAQMAATPAEIAKISRQLGRWGVMDELPHYLPLLQHPLGVPAIAMMHQLTLCGAQLETIDAATNSAAKVVSALRSYSRQSRQEELVPVNVIDNLETALTLYHNRLKKQITLNRLFQPVPPILGAPEELVQVWTNLIQNALYAMSQKGTLTVQTERLEQGVRVTLTDTGGGIPPEIQTRIFEPFFTTKPAGEGNGLGLSVVKRILDRHHALITLQSQSGYTVVQVTFPIVAPSNEITPNEIT
jgi:C4-dicarboxylate-specific signal transduction histidine kinase